MIAHINPNVLNGNINAPFSKSDAHRALIASALCKTPTEITGSCESDDLLATVRCLEALGARLVTLDEKKQIHRMEPIPALSAYSVPVLDCGESGTTLRLLLPVVAALRISANFTAKGRLPERPLGELIATLVQNGTKFDATKLPFSISGSLKSGDFRLPGNISSQYISGLLFALPLLEDSSRIMLTTRLESVAYVEMTRRTLETFGVCSSLIDENSYGVQGNQVYKTPGSIKVEGDWSNAAFFLAAGALGGSTTVSGLSETTLQGDHAISKLLSEFGANVKTDDTSVSVSAGELRAMDIDVSEIPDLFPILAVIASAAQGTTRLMNAARLRIKESDRINAVAKMLNALGADTEELPDALVIKGKPQLTGGTVDSAGDHRIVMAAAIASILCKNPVTIIGAEAVSKSYPHFFNDFNKMGGNANVVNNG